MSADKVDVTDLGAKATDETNLDVAMLLLESMFPALPIGSNEGGVSDAFSAGFFSLNLVISVLVILYCIWHFVQLLLNGAATGRMLESSMQRTATPLRMLFGVIAPLPLIKGYSLIQVLFIWLVSLAFQTNNVIWNAYVDGNQLTKLASQHPVNPEAKRLAKNVLLMSMCMRAYEHQARDDGKELIADWSVSGLNDWYFFKTGKTALTNVSNNAVAQTNYQAIMKLYEDGKDKIHLNAGVPNSKNGLIPHNACGYISFSNFKKHKEKGVTDAAKDFTEAGAITYANVRALDALDKTVEGSNLGIGAAKIVVAGKMITDGILAPINNIQEHNNWIDKVSEAQAKALTNLLLDADRIAYSIITHSENVEAEANLQSLDVLSNNRTLSPEELKAMGMRVEKKTAPLSENQIVKAIDGLARNYENTIREAAINYYGAGNMNDELKKEAKFYGWFGSGLLFNKLAVLSTKANFVALDMPEAFAQLKTQDSLNNPYFNSRYLSKVNKYLIQSTAYKDIVSEEVGISNANYADTFEGMYTQNNTTGTNDSLGDNFANSIVSGMVELIHDPSSHPLVQARSWGMNIQQWLPAAWGLALDNLNDLEGNFAKSFLLNTVLFVILGAMATLMIFLAYVIPFLPILYWLGQFFGIFVNIIIMSISAPLWAAGHVLPGGGSFAGPQAQGWRMYLVGVLKPILVLISFIFGAYIVLGLMGYLLNMIFLQLVKSFSDGSTGLSSVFFEAFLMPFVYGVILVVIINTTMQLSNQIADKVGDFIGGGFSVGDAGRGFADQSSNYMDSAGRVLAGIPNRIASDVAEFKSASRRLDSGMNKNPKLNSNVVNGTGGANDGPSWGSSPYENLHNSPKFPGGGGAASDLKPSFVQSSEGASNPSSLSDSGITGATSSISGAMSSGVGSNVGRLPSTLISGQASPILKSKGDGTIVGASGLRIGNEGKTLVGNGGLVLDCTNKAPISMKGAEALSRGEPEWNKRTMQPVIDKLLDDYDKENPSYSFASTWGGNTPAPIPPEEYQQIAEVATAAYMAEAGIEAGKGLELGANSTEMCEISQNASRIVYEQMEKDPKKQDNYARTVSFIQTASNNGFVENEVAQEAFLNARPAITNNPADIEKAQNNIVSQYSKFDLDNIDDIDAARSLSVLMTKVRKSDRAIQAKYQNHSD